MQRLLRPRTARTCLSAGVLGLLMVLFILHLNKEVRESARSSQKPLWNLTPPYPQTVVSTDREYKRILLWTSWFDWDKWFFDALGEEPFTARGCEESRCILTTNRDLFFFSHIVMVHVRNLQQGALSMPPVHPAEQRWVYMIMESPENTWLTSEPGSTLAPHDLSPLDNMFNLTMTYLSDSDVRISYGQYVPRASPLKFPQRDYSKGKDRLALWYVSNCFTEQSKMRSSFVEELTRHLHVDIYGLCGTPDPCKNDADCVRELKTHYKFYLALENSMCKDYISEKLWNTFRSEMVPIVLGADLQDYLKVAPPESFLHVDNFTSVEALAKYILYLNENDVAYNAYFKWREHFEIGEEKRSAISQAVCDLCKTAHTSNAQKSYKISEWWHPKTLCRSRYWGRR